jgi:hypothetical protein
MTRDEILKAMQARRLRVNPNVPIYEYIDKCIQAMFETAADALSEHQSGASPNTGGQPKAGGQRMHNALHAIAHNLIGYAVRPGESREGANLAAMQRIALEALDETQHKNRECLGVMDDPEHATGEKI